MPYTKTNWVAGDTVTSTKLNKIENQLETLSDPIVPWKIIPEVNGSFTSISNDGAAEIIISEWLTFTGNSDDYIMPSILKNLNIELTYNSGGETVTCNASLVTPDLIYWGSDYTSSFELSSSTVHPAQCSTTTGYAEGNWFMHLRLLYTGILPGDTINVHIPSVTLYKPNENYISELNLALRAWND